MLDRASTFADPDIIDLLRERYVPVALDCWYHERREDEKGEFYRRVVTQREGYSPDKTTQGFYVFDPEGNVFEAWNNRDPGKVRRILKKTLADYVAPHPRASQDPADPELTGEPDPAPESVRSRFDRTPPEGGLVLRVHSRILNASYAEKADRWAEIFRSSTGLDHMWVRADEVAALAGGEVPASFLNRLSRFHLIDNTRGEPPMWRADEVQSQALTLAPIDERSARKLRSQEGAQLLAATGSAALATGDASRGFTAQLGGVVEVLEGQIVRLDLVATGAYHGAGRYTGVAVPDGEFTLAIAFTLDGDESDTQIPPQGCRDRNDYLGR